MLSYWLILAAALGQTTQPTASGAAVPTTIRSRSEVGPRTSVATRPAATPMRVSAAATQPAQASTLPSIKGMDSETIRKLVAQMRPASTQPAGDAANLQQAGTLSNDPISV